MKRKVNITGLECPNCARNLETKLNKIEGVKNLKIEFVKNTLTFESDNPDQALVKITNMAKQIEPEVNISGSNPQKKWIAVDLITLAIGLAIGISLFFIKVPTWAYYTLYALSALFLGCKTYLKAAKLLFKGIINENLLITISVIGASFVSSHNEGLMVIALYSIGKIFEGLAVDRSRKNIALLAQMQPDYVNLLTGAAEQRVSPDKVEKGSLIVVRAGEKVGLDGTIVDGRAFVDNQSLTGESLPVEKSKGEQILSGGIVLDGVLVIKTSSVQADSTISKIMLLTQSASENKSKTETFISKITRWYTLGIIILSILVWGIVWAVTKDFSMAIYRGLIFLVVSCPCAFAISVPLSYFSGLGNASKHGILIKGSNFLDACANLNVVAFDKTGTLTTGKFTIQKIETFDNRTQDEVLFLAAIGEKHSIHPLAKAIVLACNKKIPKATSVKEIAGSGVEYVYKNKTYFVGRRQKLEQTAVEIYENNKKIGQIDLADTIKPQSQQTCTQLRKIGIKSIMLSGDNQKIASQVGEKVGVDQAFGNMLPQNKFDYILSLKNQKQKVGYVGDGINDAPSLTAADVGFSMGINGSPASIEASDVVIVDDDPKKILSAIKISKRTRKIVWENIAASLVVKVAFLVLGAVGVTGMLWAVFADVGVTILAILNSMRALSIRTRGDN